MCKYDLYNELGGFQNIYVYFRASFRRTDVKKLIEVFNPRVVCSIVIEITINLMRYTQARVYTCCLFSLVMYKDIPWIGIDSLLTSFSSHDPGD